MKQNFVKSIYVDDKTMGLLSGKLFPEWKVVQYIAQVAAALKDLHKGPVMHRDMKPLSIPIGIYREIQSSDFASNVSETNLGIVRDHLHLDRTGSACPMITREAYGSCS